MPAVAVRAAAASNPPGSSPSYGELVSGSGMDQADAAGWRLEDFVVNRLLDCEVGYVAASQADEGLYYIFNRRSGPISAALAISLDSP